MKNPDLSIINQPWPESELEYVDTCPYCDSSERTIAYKDVQDQVFYCAPGKWSAWDCSKCDAIYLSPRPTEISIGRAYAHYFTHKSTSSSIRQRFKTKLKNECFSQWLGININPRFNIPKLLAFLLYPLKKMIFLPFELNYLANHTRGRLLDVGCGNGNMLRLAKELGWDVTGLEIDSNAVRVASEDGLNVIQGDYRKLDQFVESFDCIICSHVLEHVHHPLMLLELVEKSLKPNGILLLSLPNAKSHVREIFGKNWLGADPPRHLVIPTLRKLIDYLSYLKFTEITQSNVYDVCTVESVRIKEGKVRLSLVYFVYLKVKNALLTRSHNAQSDFIQLTARKNS